MFSVNDICLCLTMSPNSICRTNRLTCVERIPTMNNTCVWGCGGAAIAAFIVAI